MIEKDLKEFIEKHLKDDITGIVLRSDRFKGIDVKKAVSIIESRRKLSGKFNHWADSMDLVFTIPVAVEQSSSEITAIHKQKYCKSGVIYDLTGGLGVDSFFFAKNNNLVIYFERNDRLYEEVLYNFGVLGVTNIRCFNSEITKNNAEETLSSLLKRGIPAADAIYLDPARRDKSGKRVLNLKDYEPDITELKEPLFKFTKRIIVKVSPMSDIKSLFYECGNISNIDVVSVDNECKELLLVMDRDCDVPFGSVKITAVNYSSKKGVQELCFNASEESDAVPLYISDTTEEYLYEPNSSLLKAGAFKITALRYNIRKLSVNTHLYSCDRLIKDFPGRVFEIKEVADYNKSNIRNLSKKYPKVNISVRNFPTSASDLKKILKTEDGGDITLMGCTLNNGAKKIIICRQIF